MVEGRGCPGEGRGGSTSAHAAAAHLADVERLVLVVEVPVRLVRHRGDVVHGRLLRDKRQQRAVRDPVVVQVVDPLPVALGLGGAVLVVEDEPPAGARPPLEVEV